jgi:N6-L-threonylcarbamoyladenine synthase
LAEAGVRKQEIGLVAATRGPGLAGALLVGTSFGRGLALGLNVPFSGVNHLDGHIHSVWLAKEEPLPAPPEFPLLALIVSGGHTELILARGHGEYELVGHTVDDAAGEAFDKVARLLGLGYPGGPAIQVAAASARSPISLPRAWLPGTRNFSFSGLKTATLHKAHDLTSGGSREELRGQALPRIDVASTLRQEQVADLASGFQESVVDVLVGKTLRAASELGARSVAVVGGVAANRALRERMQREATLPLFVSAPEFSTDNAAMIASAAYFAPERSRAFDVDPGLELAPA